jgi:hypothetical protein
MLSVTLVHPTLPQDIVDYLLNQSLLTGKHYSLFRHGPSSSPIRYEVREGSPVESDRSVLGGKNCDPLEEIFFDIAWVAHVHPPSQSPLPSDDDLDAIAERASIRRGRSRHTLFGFHHGHPVSVELQALYHPLMREVSLLHRASEIIAEATDTRIQEWSTS